MSRRSCSPNTYAQSAGLTEIAPEGTLQASPTLTGGVLRGGGQVSGQPHQHLGHRATGRLPGHIDRGRRVHAGRRRHARGRRRHRAARPPDGDGSGHARRHARRRARAGVRPGAGDAFPVLTSGSRTGTFATLTGTRLPGRQAPRARLPGRARLRRAAGGHRRRRTSCRDCDDLALAPSPRSRATWSSTGRRLRRRRAAGARAGLGRPGHHRQRRGRGDQPGRARDRRRAT